MKPIFQYLIYAGIALLILLFTFMGGCSYHKKNFPCKVNSDTIYLKPDTAYKEIPHWYPWLIHDTTYTDTGKVIIPPGIDSLAVAKAFYRINYNEQQLSDSAIDIKIKQTLSQNKVQDFKFWYRYKIPQQVIINTTDNSTTYNRYITLGLGVPINDINYTNVEATFNWEKGYLGAFYMPKLNNSFGIRAGATIIKFKKKK